MRLNLRRNKFSIHRNRKNKQDKSDYNKNEIKSLRNNKNEIKSLGKLTLLLILFLNNKIYYKEKNKCTKKLMKKIKFKIFNSKNL